MEKRIINGERNNFIFFRDIFDSQIKAYDPYRPKYKGLYIYAIDEDALHIPCSKDILKEGYRGAALIKYKGKERETYFPRMYLIHAYDVISGTSKNLKYSNKKNQTGPAFEIAKSFEQNSLTMYDRHYFSKTLVTTHEDANNYYLSRCTRSKHKEVTEFFNSKKRNTTIVIEDCKVRLIKIKIPKSKEYHVFATNLPCYMTNKEIQYLYAYRWEIETSFRDFTHTIKGEQWHSKTLNGVLQELYVTWWLLNFTKFQTFQNINPEDNFFKKIYIRTNFKFILNFVKDRIYEFIFNYSRHLFNHLKFLINRSKEKRKKLSRSSPRQRKSSNRVYDTIKASVPKCNNATHWRNQ
jgi:hypothetical protein